MPTCGFSEVADCDWNAWIIAGAVIVASLCLLGCFIGFFQPGPVGRCLRKLLDDDGEPPANTANTNRRPASQQGLAPPVLYVQSPAHQVGCSGEYEILAGQRPNGQPAWRKRGADRWLYSGKDGRWYIGGTSCFEKVFRCSDGFICHAEAHQGVLPHQLGGSWEWSAGAAWHPDSAISVTLAPTPREVFPPSPASSNVSALKYLRNVHSPMSSSASSGSRDIVREGSLNTASPKALRTFQERPSDISYDSSLRSSYAQRIGNGRLESPVLVTSPVSNWRQPGTPLAKPPQALMVTTPNGQLECAGLYLLVEGAYPNGQPLWQQQEGGHWLYCGTTARWCIGGQDVKEDNYARSAGWISQTAPHGGLMPDQVTAVWQRWDGAKFQRDEAIAVSGQAQHPGDEGPPESERTSESHGGRSWFKKNPAIAV